MGAGGTSQPTGPGARALHRESARAGKTAGQNVSKERELRETPREGIVRGTDPGQGQPPRLHPPCPRLPRRLAQRRREWCAVFRPHGEHAARRLLTRPSGRGPASRHRISRAQTRAQLGFSPINGSGTGVNFNSTSMSAIGVNETSGNIFVNDGYSNVTNIFSGTGGVPTGVASPYKVTGFAFYGSQTAPRSTTRRRVPAKARSTSPISTTTKSRNSPSTSAPKPTKRPANSRRPPAAAFQYPTALPSTTTATSTSATVAASRSSNSARPAPSSLGSAPNRESATRSRSRSTTPAMSSSRRYYRGKVVKYPRQRLRRNRSGNLHSGRSPRRRKPRASPSTPATNKLFVAFGDHVAEYNAATLAKGLEFGGGEITSATAIGVNSAAGRIYVGDNGRTQADSRLRRRRHRPQRRQRLRRP